MAVARPAKVERIALARLGGDIDGLDVCHKFPEGLRVHAHDRLLERLFGDLGKGVAVVPIAAARNAAVEGALLSDESGQIIDRCVRHQQMSTVGKPRLQERQLIGERCKRSSAAEQRRARESLGLRRHPKPA